MNEDVTSTDIEYYLKYGKLPDKGDSYVDILRPQTFKEYIGQSEAKELAQVMVEAARREQRALPDILIVGPYGTGKSALADVIIRASGTQARQTEAATINTEGAGKQSGTVIIDEIQNLKGDVTDSLSVLIDHRKIHIIGCTTNPGALPAPFRSRFRGLYLRPYDCNEIVMILSQICYRKVTPFDVKALSLVGNRSRLNPRVGINYLLFILDFMVVQERQRITKDLVEVAFRKLGVDDKGYTLRDRLYLKALPDRPVGIGYLSAVLGIDEKTIEQEIEPYLLQTGLIDRTRIGRVRV